MVVDGRVGRPFDAITSPLAVSDDGSVIAYSARRGTDQFCVVNDVEGPAYRLVDSPIVSRDGRHVACAVADSEGWRVLLDGRAGRAWKWVGHVTLSPSGRRLAYAAEEVVGGRYRYRMVVDGHAQPPVDRLGAPAFSHHETTVAYAARSSGDWIVRAGERILPARGAVAAVFLDGDGARVGWVEEHDRSFVVVADGRRGPMFDWIGWPAFAPDGRVVYFASRGPAKFLVVGGLEIDLGEGVIWDPQLSDDGTHITFGIRIGRGLWRRTLPLTSIR